jgi:hypothetical protein
MVRVAAKGKSSGKVAMCRSIGEEEEEFIRI